MNTLQHVTTAGTLALTALAALSIVTGVLLLRQRAEVLRSFGLMTLLWGIVNAFIAAVTYMRLQAVLTTPETMEASRHLLRLNLGLDLVYILVGVCLLRARSDRGMGFGLAVALQGVLLFLIDMVLLAAVLSM